MFCETYRPQKFEEIVGMNDIVEKVKGFITKPDGIPHLMFTGNPGTGKSTLSHVIANELYGNDKPQHFQEFNASQDRGIEFIRSVVKDLASRKPARFPYRIILLDEGDNITPDAQQCLRRLMELYHKHCRFILTGNYPGKIIDPIRSRFVHFHLEQAEVKNVASYLKRVGTKENLNKDDAFYINIAKETSGDFRKALNRLETGELKTSDLSSLTSEKYFAMNRDQKVELVFQSDPDAMFNRLFEIMKEKKSWDMIPFFIDCQSKMGFSSANKIIPVLGLVEKFK